MMLLRGGFATEDTNAALRCEAIHSSGGADGATRRQAASEDILRPTIGVCGMGGREQFFRWSPAGAPTVQFV